MVNTAIIVPARLASTRFPRKLLHEIRGKPLVIWVAERIVSQAPEFPLYFAVDDEELMWVLTSRGYKALLTDPTHPSGTDRIAAANVGIGADFVVNVQADEPLVTAEQLQTLARLVTLGAPMATLGTPFSRVQDFANPNQVKVLVGRTGDAVYFSRAQIPYARESAGAIDPDLLGNGSVLRHLGLYAYQAEFLTTIGSLPMGRLEQIEKLEQLRVLENGYRIAVGCTDQPTIGIDTPEDAAEFERYLDRQQGSE